MDECSPSFAAKARIVTESFQILPYGGSSAPHYQAPLICGCPPQPAYVERMSSVYSCEFSLYPSSFFTAIGFHSFFMCEQLRYGTQPRRDVPDLGRGFIFSDLSDLDRCRSRRNIHHELGHFLDCAFCGPLFTATPDPEWEQHNPPGFCYGAARGVVGGEHMREAGVADFDTAPSIHFLNQYSTSCVAEDKAEVWAALMCHCSTLSSPPLQQKAALLQRRALLLCSELTVE